MKKVTLILMVTMFIILASNVFAGVPVVVDQTGMDYQTYWYTGTFGQQIVVDSEGKVHVVYCKTWCTETDTGYQVMYANVTDGTKIEVPSQEPDDIIQPGVIFIDGGYNNTPIYMCYGVGGRMFAYGPTMHLQAMAKLSSDGTAVEPLGMQEGKNYYADPHYSIPIEMQVDNVNGIAHIIQTNPSGAEVSYWNFDGTNFSQPFNLMSPFPGDGVPGCNFDGRYRRNGTKGADIAVSSDGSEVTVATLHTAQNVLLHKGTFGGAIWADEFLTGLEDGSMVALFSTDTLLGDIGTNIPNNDPKPFTDVQVSYDANDNLHVIYEATYIDVFLDTTRGYWSILNWGNLLYGGAGDTNAVFYDGSEHPKPQLRYWNDITGADVLLAECTYPLAGETYEWFSTEGEPDSGRAWWRDNFNDSPISNIEFLVNKDPQVGEPLLVCVWEEMQGDVTALADLDDYAGKTYYASMTDLKVSVSMDGTTWSAPYNITNTADKDENGVSVFRDVIDNKIHMVYSEDMLTGCDRPMAMVDSYEDMYLQGWAPAEGASSISIRKPTTEQVNIVYGEFDLGTITGVESNPTAMPAEFSLSQNYPNPFNPTTLIKYSVPTGNVTLEIYNMLGQKVRTLINKKVAAGSYDIVWDGTDYAGKQVSSAVYIYQLKSDAGVKAKKMLFQK